MKFICRALCVLLVTVLMVRAQDDDDEAVYGDYQPTLDDDLIQYVPKYTVRLGFRGITGVKSQFGGQGTFMPSVFTAPDTRQYRIGVGDRAGLANRIYSDGYVGLDTRTTTDPSGGTVPISPDGRTNNWTFTDASQVRDDGTIAMHYYEARLTDTGFQDKKMGVGAGVELAVERDFGSLFGTRMQWGVIGGMSVNQFNAIRRNTVQTELRTITDYYSLGGQAAPDPGYQGPQFLGGVDISVLLGNEVLHRTDIVSSNADFLTTRWQSRGAYLTFRAGPTLYIPLGRGFSASLSAGAVVVYAGSTYSVTQHFAPATGGEHESEATDNESAILPGFYIDATVQWAMTETAGLYVGAVYQSSGDYSQTIATEDEELTYTNRIDLTSLQGLRAGVNFRF